MAQGWRLQLAVILVAALALRCLFFVGFGLGDDLGYIAHADQILSGNYPSLDPLNQYAYRPLLLLLFAAGIGVFGHTDLGVVAPVLLASIATTAVVYLFVRHLVDPEAAWWCALLYACEPFNAVNSTTMTNDVILSCLTFAALGLFLAGDRAADARRSVCRFVAAGALMLAAFLVKITFVPVLCVLAAYSLLALRRGPRAVLIRHGVFYSTVLAGLAIVCLTYYFIKGDFLWQFKAETFYYRTYRPDWYLSGAIDYRALMWQYPRSLFGLSGYPSYRYLEHGLLFWWFVPASIVVFLRRGNGVLKLLVALVLVVFAFFQFYPQYLTPWYLPLVRQERYLEMLLPAAVIVAGTAFHWLHKRRPVLAVALLSVMLTDFVVEAARRSEQYDDSQEDVRALAHYAASTVAQAGSSLAVDRPAGNALSFYLRGVPVPIEQAGSGVHALERCYVAVGGARSFWWSRDEVLDISPDRVPPHWILAYEVPAPRRPWRPSNLRVYYVSEARPDWYPMFDAPRPDPPSPVVPGLAEAAFPDGFDRPPVQVGKGTKIPDLDNSTTLAAPRLEWTGWLQAEDGVYTFESTSDDGSWIYLNDRLLLDNGGTHPAKLARRTVRLARGWYAFRLRYEDTGGDRFLRVRLFRNHLPLPTDSGALFFSIAREGQG